MEFTQCLIPTIASMFVVAPPTLAYGCLHARSLHAYTQKECFFSSRVSELDLFIVLVEDSTIYTFFTLNCTNNSLLHIRIPCAQLVERVTVHTVMSNALLDHRRIIVR